MSARPREMKWARAFVAVSCLIWIFAFPAHSMSFQVTEDQQDPNVKVVIAEGTIEKGDADRFAAIIGANPPDVPVLFVTSLGGNVAAAMELAKQIKARSYAIIADKECASACASILFPSGVFSILTPGSVLGFHSCSRDGKRQDWCNEEIGNFAVENGFTFGTLDHFFGLYGPGEMKWMTEISARCFGYYRASADPKPIHGGRKACVDGIIFSLGKNIEPRPFGPSFDCGKASTRVEQLFCADRELMQSDSILGLVYDTAMNERNGRDKDLLRESQLEWITKRNADCDTRFRGNLDFANTRAAAMCLYKYNESRIYELIDNPLLLQQ